MSSEIVEPETSRVDDISGDDAQAGDESLKGREASGSGDELSLNLLLGQAPDPMLDTLSGSSDELTRLIADAKPDPMLAEDSQPEPARGDETIPPAVEMFVGDHSDARDSAAEPIGDSEESALSEFGSILASSSVTSPSGRKAPEPPEDELEDDDDSSRGNSILVMLLASYASAVTIGLLWVLLSGRRLQESPRAPDEAPATEATAPNDPGLRADRSRLVIGPIPIPEAQRASLGKTIRVGNLEITPLALSEGPVQLARALGDRELKNGGEHALKLRIRFRNVSQAGIFAPLDEALIRQRLRAEPESFIESKSGEAIIAQYPLAEESEWSIVGQAFRELRPQESFESLIVSEPEAMKKTQTEMVWRIHLRTGIEMINDFGAVIRADEIKSEN